MIQWRHFLLVRSGMEWFRVKVVDSLGGFGRFSSPMTQLARNLPSNPLRPRASGGMGEKQIPISNVTGARFRRFDS